MWQGLDYAGYGIAYFAYGSEVRAPMKGAGLTAKRAAFVREYLVDLNATQAAIRAGIDLPECVRNERGYYVYLLTNPASGEVFYVGKGKRHRFAAHEMQWRTGGGTNGAKLAKIAEAMSAAGRVSALRFAGGLTSDEAYQLERATIAAIGIDRLTNATPGQETAPERAAFLLSTVKPFCIWATERARSEADRRMYHMVVDGLREVAGAA